MKKIKKNQIKSKNKFKNLKNDYFLQEVFNNLEKGRALNMVKYNKYITKRININISDYREYSEKYSSIEIEIKPVINKCGKFINIKDEKKIYYHLYFNNNKEGIKKTELNKEDTVSKINITIDYQIESFFELFKNCKCIESINFKNFLEIM